MCRQKHPIKGKGCRESKKAVLKCFSWLIYHEGINSSLTPYWYLRVICDPETSTFAFYTAFSYKIGRACGNIMRRQKGYLYTNWSVNSMGNIQILTLLTHREVRSEKRKKSWSKNLQKVLINPIKYSIKITYLNHIFN